MFVSQISRQLCCPANLIGVDPTPIFRPSKTDHFQIAILNISFAYHFFAALIPTFFQTFSNPNSLQSGIPLSIILQQLGPGHR